jgi:hypothetical protein
MKIKLRGKTVSPGIGTRIVMSRSETVIAELAMIAAQTAQEVSGKENERFSHFLTRF